MVLYLYNVTDDYNSQAPSIHSFTLQIPIFRSPSLSSTHKYSTRISQSLGVTNRKRMIFDKINPLNTELNPICQ